MVPIYEPMSDRQKDYNALHGLSTTPKIVGYSVDLGNGQFGNYDANKNFLGNVSDNKGGFMNRVAEALPSAVMAAGLNFITGGAASALGEQLMNAGLASTAAGANAAAGVIIRTGISVAAGESQDEALKNGLMSLAASQVISPTVTQEVKGIIDNPTVQQLVSNTGTSLVTGVLQGKSPTEIANSVLGSATGFLNGSTPDGGGDSDTTSSNITESGGDGSSGVPSILTEGSSPGAAQAAATEAEPAAGLESLPAYDQYVPPEAVSAPPSIPAYDTYVPPESVAAPTAAELIAAGTTSGGTLPTAPGNEAVASGMSPGSLGAEAAASGVLTDAQLAAATGAGGIGALTGADAAAANLTKSTNEAVASGTAPGSAGAAQGAAGTLTDAQLNAANGVTTGGISALDAAKKLLNAKNLIKFLGIGAGAAAIGGALNKSGPDNSAYQGTIPEYTASRTQYPVSETRPSVGGKPYRPGQGGITYFSPMTYTPKAAGGGLMGLAGGGMPQEYNLGSYSDGGRLLKGPGDGVSDSIPAIIGKKQPARLATGEFVVPARIVSELGNGSTEAGAKRLYEMMDRIQKTRRKTKNVAANTNAAKYLPA
jgi:hypothetical protein